MSTKRFFRLSLSAYKNFYVELGVKPSVSESEIKKAYFSLAKQFHPDLNPDPSARSKFEKIAQAYETLSDESKRDAYDK